MQTGQKFHLLFADDILKELQIIKEKEIICFTLEDTGWQSLVKIRELNTLIRFARGDVDSSLYNAAVDANIPLPVLMEMIQLFSFEVDFQRDIYNGDYFQVAYEDILDEHGNSVDTGRVIFAYLFSNGATVKHELYRYKDFQGNWDYYNSLGHTIRRELLKTPVNGAYISSGYGMRVSPFLGYSKMHQGMDFAAPQGTPIYAAGGGTITTAGWSNVYGWYIKIRHVNHYETLYGHMVSFRSGLRRGSRVEQGQIIGYVGSTGMSTGPHCHYEVHYYGEPINPSTVRFPPGKILQGEVLELFQVHREGIISSFL
jgi:murein DD-endopeptidase MepM/ murein hydrolase activator NlpD